MMQENSKSFFSEPPLDGRLADNSAVAAFIQSVNRNWNSIRESGAFVFDIDETLVPPDDSLERHEPLTQLLLRLINSGIRISLISGGPGTVIENRILKPLEARGLTTDIFRNFTLYTNGGSTKLTFDGMRWLEDEGFTSVHQIPGETLERFRTVLEAAVRRGMELSDADRESLLRIWREKRHEQWKNCRIEFRDGWMRGEPWRLEFWDDQNMASVKAGKSEGQTSYPFINIRGVQYASGSDVRSVLGFSAAGFYALSREKGDLVDFDVRTDLIRQIETADPEAFSRISMRKAGRSSIDVTRKGADKAAALKDFIESTGCHPSLVFYFGDEFYSGGNDQPIAESPELKKLGLCILALNRETAPVQTHILWLGRSTDATCQFLASLPV